jgi:two-component system, NtrC family, sensor histidine kinase GlrK
MQNKLIIGYPRSFLRFILLSYVLVSLPILGAAIYSVITMNTVSKQNTLAVVDATRTIHLSRDLVNRLTEMERGLRQYAVLGDPALLVEFRSNGDDFVQILKRIAAVHPTQGIEAPLYPLVQQAIEASGVPVAQGPAATQAGIQNAMNVLEKLGQALPGVIQSVENNISAEISGNEALAASTQTSLLISLLVSVLLAALIVLMFRRQISVLMRQFEHAVETLGAGQYVEEINFSGPEDIRFLGERLEWLRLRLKELEAQRHHFLRNVSHGLKTPLTVLREGSQLLADGVSGTLSQQQQLIVGIMNENGSRLQRMIEDLLRAQQASLAVAGISPKPVRLDRICQQVIQDHQLLAEKRQIRLLAELPAVALEAVADNLYKVVDNLLSNAIKFSPEGSQVQIRLHADKAELTLTITDEGPGILEHEKDLVFEPFFRGSSTRSAGVEGSGVGLAISRDYVTAHRGTLSILPVPRGACLEVKLPLRQPHKVIKEPAHA